MLFVYTPNSPFQQKNTIIVWVDWVTKIDLIILEIS